MAEFVPSPPVKRQWRRLKIILLIFVVIVALAAAAGVALRAKYNDEFIRAELERHLGDALAADCKIGGLQLSLFGGNARLTDLQITLAAAANSSAPKELLTVKTVDAHLGLTSVLFGKARGNVLIDGWQVNVVREPRQRGTRAAGRADRADRGAPAEAAETSDDEHTTNIRQALDGLRDLPWDDYLKNLDLLAYVHQFSFVVANGKVTLSDASQRLGDCRLEVVRITADKNGDALAAAARMRLVTPQVPAAGAFNLTVSADLAPRAAGLARLSRVKIESDLTDFDLPYVTRYYGAGFRWQKNRIVLGAPFAGKFSASGDNLADGLTLAFNLSTPRLLELFPRRENETPFPGLTVNGDAAAKPTGEWQLKNLDLQLGDASATWLRLLAGGTGNLDRDLNFQLALTQDLTAFATSDLAKRLNLANLCQGETQLRVLAQTVKTPTAADHATISLAVESANLGLRVNDRMQEFPFHGRAQAEFDAGEAGARNLVFTAEAVAGDEKNPTISVKTPSPLTLPSPAAWQHLRGQLQFAVNAADLSRRCRAMLKELGVGDINEQIVGQLQCTDDQYQAALRLTPVGGNAAPVELALNVVAPTSPQVKITGEIKATPQDNTSLQATINRGDNGVSQIKLTVNSALTLETASALQRRFMPIFSTAALPDAKGNFRGALEVTASGAGDRWQADARFNSLVENAQVRQDQYLWREPKAQLSGVVDFTAAKGAQNLTVKQLQIRSSAANVNLVTGAVPLHLANSLPELLDQLPAFNVALVVGENAWRQIDRMLGGKIPPAIFGLDSQLTVRAEYAADKKLLAVPEISVKGGKSGALLQEFSLATAVSNPGKIAASPTPATALASLPQGLLISRAVLSVAGLKKLLGEEGNASVRALQGENFVLTNWRLTPREKDFILTGMAEGALSFAGAAQREPLLQLSGAAGFPAEKPLTVQIADGGQTIIAAGMLDMTGAAIHFGVMDPYVYDKKKGEPLHLQFSARQHADGKVEVPSVVLDGKLPVSLDQFALDAGGGNIAVKLAAVKIGAPFNITAQNIDLDKNANRLRGEVAVGHVDLAMLSPFMPSIQNLSLSGALESARVKLDSPYTSLLGATVDLAAARGSLQVGSLAMSATNTQNRATVHTSFSGMNFDTASSTLTIRDLTLTNPAFSATPVLRVPSITVTPRLASLSPFTIDQVLLTGLQAVYEKQKNGNTNVEALSQVLDGISSDAGGGGGSPSASAGQASGGKSGGGGPAASGGQSLLINTLQIQNGEVSIVAPGAIYDGKKLPLNVTINDVTSSSTSSIIMQVIKSMFGAIMLETVKSILNVPNLVGLVSDGLINNLSNLGDLKIGDVAPLKMLEGLGKFGVNTTGDVVNTAGNLVKGILGKDADDADNNVLNTIGGILGAKKTDAPAAAPSAAPAPKAPAAPNPVGNLRKLFK
ncbi:MAG: hypothetical protein LBP75_11515 [Planctomycetota bacterium]|jgi:hypothetical protein|nr:hypothetical protein [Planctomycetota bacterium]